MATAQTTTTSGLTTLAGNQGEIYINTDTDSLIFFNDDGIGNYKEFSNDGTVGASINLNFNDNGAGDETIYDSMMSNTFDLSASALSGYYKRYDLASDAITDIGNETNMAGGSFSSSTIPGSDQQGSIYYSPVMYQANGANAPYVATYDNPVVFVFTGSVHGGDVTSITVTNSNSDTWYYVPMLYLINEGDSVTAPFWGLTMAVNENSNIYFPYDGDPSNTSSSTEWGILHWGSGYVTTGNNEATLRQGLSLSGGDISTSSSYGSYAVGSWSLEHAYTP
tara:strand:+ start:327 stop:1163 length:837 start_codon:yes stop_codon:yes gene_type:complete